MIDLTIISLFCECKIDNVNVLNIKENKDLNKIKNIKTKYVMFFREENEFKNVDFSKILDYMNENKLSLYALCPKYKNNNKLVNANFNNTCGLIKTEEERFNLNLDSYILDKKLLDDVKYSDMFEENALINIFSKTDMYYQSKDEIVVKKIDIIKDNALYPNYSNKEWYLSYVNNLISFTGKSHHVDALILALFLERIYVNSKESTIKILSSIEYDEFIDLSSKLIKKIDDDLLCSSVINKSIGVSYGNHLFVVRLKYKDKLKTIDGNLYCNDVLLFKKEDLSCRVQTINYKDGYLVFDCKVNSGMQECSNIDVIYNGKKIKYNETHIYSDSFLFGEKVYRDYTFQFKIDASLTGKLEFRINNEKVKIVFQTIHSRLHEKFKSYWNINNRCLKYKNNQIIICKRSFINTFISEIKYDFSVLRKDKKKSLKSIFIRILYYLTLPYYSKKDIWLTYDKIYKSGDCGEYLYRYMLKKNKYMYYILSPKAKFYNKIKNETGNVISYGSVKCKLLCLHSKKMFVSDSISAFYCSLSSYMTAITRGLLNYQVNCIQHGLTMQDIAHRQNRLFDNIENYFVASEYERKNLLKPEYGYSDDQIKMTGIPRFDGLKDKPSKTILLAPTWRVDVASNTSKDRVRVHNNNFKNTNYFKIFNSIINNKELLETLKKHNYKMIFLIHPTLISNKDDYDTNDYVKIYSSADVNYEDILTTARLMITDYSGVQYDFAYMNKPLIYFHTEALPPSYGDGMMNYRNMGFGPVISTEEELIKEIKKAFDKNFENGAKYTKRVQSFFKYLDYNNCKRIYDEVVGDKNDSKNN